MDFIRELLSDQSYFIGLILVLLDGILIICFILLWNRRPSLPEGSEELKASLESLIDEMNDMAQGFAANLEERKVIIQRIVARLDEKILEAEKVRKNLEEAIHRASAQPVAMPAPQKTHEAEHVLMLARKGFDAEAIARRLQKPLGEVELILNLQKLSSETL